MAMEDDDDYVIGRIYDESYRMEQEKKLNAFMQRHKYIPAEKLRGFFADTKRDFNVRTDQILGFRDDKPLSVYNGRKWVIEVFPDRNFDINRLNSCMLLKTLFSKYHMSYVIKDITEAGSIVKQHNQRTQSVVRELEDSSIITEWDF